MLRLPLNGRSVALPAKTVDLTKGDASKDDGGNSNESSLFTYPFEKSPIDEVNVIDHLKSGAPQLYRLDKMGFLVNKDPSIIYTAPQDRSVVTIGNKEIEILRSNDMLNDMIVYFFTTQ